MGKNSRLQGPSLPDWDSYIQPRVGRDYVDQCRSSCHNAFENHREFLATLFLEMEPKRIGCLGAGCLNDIPIEKFLSKGSEVFLVDWVPNLSKEGFKTHIIRSDNKQFSCFLCHLPCNPRNFCESWTEKTLPGHDVCENFNLGKGDPPRCENYRPGDEPRFIEADVTMGRGSEFARRAGKLISSSGSPVQAIRKALDETQRCENVQDRIKIPDNSLDLVTSSMVISQFDNEPITFLSKLLQARFGDRLFAQEDRINHLLNQLGSEIFRVQVEGHVKELYRLVEKTQGRVYFSVELFRTMPGREEFFLVGEIPGALDLMGKYFFFDFETIPADHTLQPVPMGEGISILQNYLLIPKTPRELSLA